MSEPSPIRRFDGIAAWARLPADRQDMIGALALELIATWHALDRLSPQAGDGHLSGLPGAILRATDVAETQIARELESAVVTALPDSFRQTGALPALPASLGMACRVCGCTEYDPCPEGCAWAAEDLCTACAFSPSADD